MELAARQKLITSRLTDHLIHSIFSSLHRRIVADPKEVVSVSNHYYAENVNLDRRGLDRDAAEIVSCLAQLPDGLMSSKNGGGTRYEFDLDHQGRDWGAGNYERSALISLGLAMGMIEKVDPNTLPKFKNAEDQINPDEEYYRVRDDKFPVL